jgi:hypothetical protein
MTESASVDKEIFFFGFGSATISYFGFTTGFTSCFFTVSTFFDA